MKVDVSGQEGEATKPGIKVPRLKLGASVLLAVLRKQTYYCYINWLHSHFK